MDRVLIAGTAKGHLRKYNVATGRLLFRLTVDSARAETLIWSVGILPYGLLFLTSSSKMASHHGSHYARDDTIYAGDSHGNVTFWDGEQGTLVQTISTHEADVLCIAVTPDGSQLFASGIDSKIVKMTRIVDEATKALSYFPFFN